MTTSEMLPWPSSAWVLAVSAEWPSLDRAFHRAPHAWR